MTDREIKRLLQEREELIEMLERCLEHISYFNQERFGFIDEEDPHLEKDLRELIEELRGDGNA